MRHFREQITFILIVSALIVLSIYQLYRTQYQDIHIKQSISSIEVPETTTDNMPITKLENIQEDSDYEVLKAAGVTEVAEFEELTYIGTYNMSHYCIQVRHDIANHGTEWCGNSNKGAKGHTLIPNYSIAVPKQLLNSSLPVGTKVRIKLPDGSTKEGIVHDTGGALGKKQRIDMCVATHEEAMRKGVVKGIKLYKLN